ncbi:estradiol 17-beta-dehydrogenase 11-like isoform X2 [Teleopsis dalmanni]|uniref:estradiol 17-beta-dehydrogenase 11-like isoform X2 n=1 Tax=Teleopsis dalmanni TaxID=139649 RepID=UPI0018CD4E42|nr:estradiol 17-beta-dehydrogenase 11-like isoform X2 [Teleopsis dalmanni]
MILIMLSTPIAMFLGVMLKIYNRFFELNSVKSITGDIAVVTGGARGLGKLISIELAKQGCHIVIADIDLKQAEETANYLSDSYKVNAKAYKVDVSNYEEVVELNKNIIHDLGKATILVNNAGIMLFTDPSNPDWKEVQRMINVNLTANIWTNRVFLENMKEVGKGHIVAISSVAGITPFPFHPEYTSTKYAIRGLMQVLRIDLKMEEKFRNIKTTSVFPTFLNTNANILEMLKSSTFSKIAVAHDGEKVAKRIIQGILQNEEEISVPEIKLAFSKCTDLWPVEIFDRIVKRILLKEEK